MPEMIEVEAYRHVADQTVGHRITKVRAPDAWFLKRGATASSLRTALRGRTVVATRRIGKVLLLDTDGPTLGLRFGMTGRLVVDGRAPIEKLEYSSHRVEPAWIRFALGFETLGHLELVDPRRLGGVELEPLLDGLGPDALAITHAELARRVSRSRAPLKAFLLDQSRVAGIGNLLADEMLWRGGLDPNRPASSLDAAEVRRLHRVMRSTLSELMRRGGSHTGDLQVARLRGAACPRDGELLERRTIGGRTTYYCPRHQR